MPNQSIRVLTWNIHKGIGGVDRRYDLSRVIDSVRHYQADIAFLQEVDDGVPRSRFHRQVDMLSESLEFPHTLYQVNVRLKQGGYGNAILSRFPIHSGFDVSLKTRLKKNRRAIVAKLQLDFADSTRTLVLVNAHLGLAGYERKLQLRKLLEYEVLRHVRRDTAMILGGDMNDVYHSLDSRLFRSGFQSAIRNGRTFPAFMPVRSLDRLYYRGKIQLDHAFVGKFETARRASDHLPLIADFQFD